MSKYSDHSKVQRATSGHGVYAWKRKQTEQKQNQTNFLELTFSKIRYYLDQIHISSISQ